MKVPYEVFVESLKKGFVGKLETLPISSAFGYRTINGKSSFHYGVDITVPSGTSIYVPLSGMQISDAGIERDDKGNSKGYGRYLRLRKMYVPKDCTYNNMYCVIYITFAHLSAFVGSALNYANGNQSAAYSLKEGNPIAKSGGDPKTDPEGSGTSTGAHIHLQIEYEFTRTPSTPINRTPIDPFYLFLKQHQCIYYKNKNVLCKKEENILKFPLFQCRSKSNCTKKNSLDNKDCKTVLNRTEIKKPKEDKKAVQGLAPGIWQITKLLIDSSVDGKQVATSGLSTMQGSLLNYFRTVCQQPMVEIMGDTFGSQYYWIVRKPPFDREGVKRFINTPGYILDIDSESVINSNFSWNTRDIFSWYQYIPYYELLEIQQTNLFVPAVLFPEYATIWGSKPLTIRSNYYNDTQSGLYNSMDIKSGKENGDRIIGNAINDLRFIIESNAYNPFTRRGTITIRGDRRIKRGTWIFFQPTTEIFYVDSVSNEYSISTGSISRTTTLQVSRGMLFDLVVGERNDKTKQIYSYFNIIDFGNIPDKINSGNWLDIVSKWKVNTEVFNYFLTRNQRIMYAGTGVIDKNTYSYNLGDSYAVQRFNVK